MSAHTIVRLKITLDDVKPAVLRRVEVPFDIRLDRLHLTRRVRSSSDGVRENEYSRFVPKLPPGGCTEPMKSAKEWCYCYRRRRIAPNEGEREVRDVCDVCLDFRLNLCARRAG